jgi:ribonuclease P protein component
MALDRECPPLLAEMSSIADELRGAKFYQHRQRLSEKICKITKSKDYKSFYGAKLVATQCFVIYYLPADINFSYGITVTKRIGNAVIRNRHKRIIKSLIRDYYKNICLKPLKINITTKVSITKKDYAAISQDFNYAMNKVLKNV